MPQHINIVVPTRERADTLLHCLETAVAQDCDAMTIWVSDNASSPATRDTVMSFGDSRIRYLNTGTRISMSHNFEFALRHLREGWIVVIGDDDGLVPGRLVPAIEALEESGLETLGSETCMYNWPGAAPETPIRLTVPLTQGYRRYDSLTAIRKAFRWEADDHRPPWTYTGGIVHFDLFDRIRAKRGGFYQSQIPDIYSSYALLGSTKHFLYSEAPFAISGRSGHSNGAALFARKKTAFLDEGLIPFHADFPMPEGGTLTFSMPAMICESYMQSSYLHNDVAGVSRQAMLELIMSENAFGGDVIYDWGRQFSALHGLDYAAAIKEAGRFKPQRKLADLKRKATSLWTRARLYTDDPRPLANVREAAETADLILRSPPSRVAESWKTIRRSAET